MPEQTTLHGLVLIGPTSTLLLFGRATHHLLPHLAVPMAFGPELDGSILDALMRLGSATMQGPESKVCWKVVDLRTPESAAGD